MKNPILMELKKYNGYISGEQLSDKFNITRAAIWKNISKLKNKWYIIESVSGKGYKLIKCPDILNEDEITENISTKFIGHTVYFYDEIDSTNKEAKRMAVSGAPDGSIFTAEIQNQGRGRLGRKWLSPKYVGLWFSILLYPDLTPDRIIPITLVAGISVCKALISLGFDAKIKWPNDIVINGKKICGILTEMTAEAEHISSIVVGIGINVNTKSFNDDIKDKATSLYIESGKSFLRKEILCSVLEIFEKYYIDYLDSGLNKIIDDYNNLCINIGKEVVACSTKEEIKGKAVKVKENGALCIATDNGIKEVNFGEVSIRGMMGYI